ncbi:MAG TPA: phosphatidylglycerophosphatase A [Rhodopila sp.]|uniref:phosphatidylglycerophosphatase A family protein n=1 Tax=Rhodopila sp. TaxID=2480087 RepID=UPI002C81DE0C|nr:phosphatidylglycerophosphatase A [Rhodopila sp.]HVY15838.1 phosphatidylglycerophosphatase A [Rhodopila sp.]
MTSARLIAAGLGTGFAPIAPGTVASLAALLTGVALFALSPWLLLVAAVAATVGGYAAIVRLNPDGDHGWIVIDEVAGQWLTLLGLARLSWTGCILAFVLFRLLDVTKLGPIGWADRRHNPFGIMADDVIAGIIAGLLLFALGFLRPYWMF